MPKRLKPFFYNKKRYHSIKELAADLDVSYAYASYLIRHNVGPKRVVILGKPFPSKAAAARYYHMQQTTLENHLAKYGPDDPRVVQHREPKANNTSAIRIDMHTYDQLKIVAMNTKPRSLKPAAENIIQQWAKSNVDSQDLTNYFHENSTLTKAISIQLTDEQAALIKEAMTKYHCRHRTKIIRAIFYWYFDKQNKERSGY